MMEIQCDRCKKHIKVDKLNDSEFIAAKSGDEIMCDDCQRGWIKEKNKMNKQYQKDVKKERDKYIGKK